MHDAKLRVPRRRPLPIFKASFSPTSSMTSSDDTHPGSPPTVPLLARNIGTQSEPALPPTTHHLAPHERSKLMRSTRKLGQLLGATPHVVEFLAPPPPPAQKPTRRSTLGAVPATTTSSTLPSGPAPYGPRPPALHLSIEPPSPTRHRRASISSGAPSVPASPSPSDRTDADPATARRLKMDKLKRTLGENVPAELVFRGPVPLRPTNSKVFDAEAARAKLLPRSKSADAARADSGKKGVGFSLWKRASQGVLPQGKARSKPGVSAHTRPLPPPPSPSTALSEKQRVINVRRATKMAQVFGAPPPHALYLITNTSLSADTDEGRERVNWEREREPVKEKRPLDEQTLAGLAYMLDYDRDSLYDLLSTVRGADAGEDVEWPYENDRHRERSLTSCESQSHDTFSSCLHPCRAPANPLIKPSDTPPTAVAGEEAFHARRKRATKLSQFFGVGYHDLFESMLTFPPVDPRPRPYIVQEKSVTFHQPLNVTISPPPGALLSPPPSASFSPSLSTSLSPLPNASFGPPPNASFSPPPSASLNPHFSFSPPPNASFNPPSSASLSPHSHFSPLPNALYSPPPSASDTPHSPFGPPPSASLSPYSPFSRYAPSSPVSHTPSSPHLMHSPVSSYAPPSPNSPRSPHAPPIPRSPVSPHSPGPVPERPSRNPARPSFRSHATSSGRPSSVEERVTTTAGSPWIAEGAGVTEKDGRPKDLVGNGARTRRRSASLNLLSSEGAAGARPAWFPMSQSAFETVPSSPPPFTTFFQSHQEVEEDRHPDGDGAAWSEHETGRHTPLAGGRDDTPFVNGRGTPVGNGRETPLPPVSQSLPSSTVHLQGKGVIQRVVSVSRGGDERRRRAKAGVDTYDVMHRLRELPGGR